MRASTAGCAVAGAAPSCCQAGPRSASVAAAAAAANAPEVHEGIEGIEEKGGGWGDSSIEQGRGAEALLCVAAAPPA